MGRQYNYGLVLHYHVLQYVLQYVSDTYWMAQQFVFLLILYVKSYTAWEEALMSLNVAAKMNPRKDTTNYLSHFCHIFVNPASPLCSIHLTGNLIHERKVPF